MRNKLKAKLKARHEQFLKNLEIITNYFDTNYPDWKKGKDYDYIKIRINKAAKIMTNNINKKKTKVIEKKDCSGEWPFYADKIKLVQTSKIMISVIIDNQEYALNGLAESALKLKFAHDAKKAIVGKSIAEFIDMGMRL